MNDTPNYKTMKTLIILLLVLFQLAGLAQDNDNLTWPREIESGKFTITLYQPQIERFYDNVIDGRLALSVKDSTAKLYFGALWFEAKLSTNLDERTATLNDLEIPKVKFPDITDESNLEKLKNLIVTDMMELDMVMSLDRIIASAEHIDQLNDLEKELNNAPPKIYFRNAPTVLVNLDGPPSTKEQENSNISLVINTPFFIAEKSDVFYVKGGPFWYSSDTLVSNTSWQHVSSVPDDVRSLSESKIEEKEADNTPQKTDTPPNILVVDEPSELIVTDGDMKYEPVEKTSLLYVTNTENDIIMDINSQQHFLLLNGRWFRSKTLEDGGWMFTEPGELPEEFAKIPDSSAVASVLVSVPGTKEAQEAIYEQNMPQTAEIDRKTAKASVEYDGEPKFEKIEGTTMSYAVNTQSSVVLVNNMYYCVDNGVWFQSKAPQGPWVVSDSRPEEISELPPSAPVYNIKYVYIYDATPDVVYVGYTPGYYNSYYYGGVVVYGTGYYYRPWTSAYYYPRPVTFGYGVHYNPYTGWGFSVGVSYGWLTISSNRYSYWGPAGYSHGYRHGYYNGYHHGYHNGYAAGYTRGRRSSSNNIYRNRPNGVNRTAGMPRSRPNRPTAAKPNSRPATRPTSRPVSRPSSKPNNMFSDRNGNVHSRDLNGNWNQQRSQFNSSRPNVSKPRPNPSLDRQFQNRSRGNSYHQSMRSRPMPRSAPSMNRRPAGGRAGGYRRH